MGFRFSKSIRLGKFIRLNISRAGLGGSIGIGPLRFGTGPRGTRFTADLPGAGTSYVKQWGGACCLPEVRRDNSGVGGRFQRPFGMPVRARLL